MDQCVTVYIQDGQLDLNEFRAAMTKINGGHEIQDRFVERAFERCDTNHDGSVSYEEFKQGEINMHPTAVLYVSPRAAVILHQPRA